MKPARKSNRIIILPFFLLLIFLFGCDKQSLDDESAVKIYVQNLIVEEKYVAFPDSIDIYKQKIYSKFNSSKKDFDNYLKNLEVDPEKWQNFFKQADMYMTELKKDKKIN